MKHTRLPEITETSDELRVHMMTQAIDGLQSHAVMHALTQAVAVSSDGKDEARGLVHRIKAGVASEDLPSVCYEIVRVRTVVTPLARVEPRGAVG